MNMINHFASVTVGILMFSSAAGSAGAPTHPPGQTDPSFHPGSSINDVIHALKILDDDTILIGGGFTTLHGLVRPCFARLHADGSTDATFMRGLSGPNGRVTAMTIQNDGKIVIAGAFDQVNPVEWSRVGRGVRGARIARLNSDGSLDPSFVAGREFPRTVRVVVEQSDGTILVGGDADLAGSSPFPGIARLNGDGSIDGSFVPQTRGDVDSLAVQENGQILIGGSFTIGDSSEVRRVARLNADGALDSATGNIQNGGIGFVKVSIGVPGQET